MLMTVILVVIQRLEELFTNTINEL